MRVAVISLTKKGRELSRTISDGLLSSHSVSRYCFYRHADEDAKTFVSIMDVAAELFHIYDALIFITACGIAVRAIAPHVCSKLKDPAVIAADESGKWVIPLLSGHIGGANSLAGEISRITGALAVITTATDAAGRFSPDLFAMANNLVITDMDAAKYAAAASANGEPIYFYSEYGHGELPEGLICIEGKPRLEQLANEGSAVIYAGPSPLRHCAANVCSMLPRNIALGIGCKKGVSSEQIEAAVDTALKESGIRPERIMSVGTIDIKRNEPGLRDFCRKRGLLLHAFSAAELNSASEKYGREYEFEASDFVRTVTGTDNVCERSAAYLSCGGRLVIHKTRGEGVTAAAAEKEVFIRFDIGTPQYTV